MQCWFLCMHKRQSESREKMVEEKMKNSMSMVVKSVYVCVGG